MSDRSEAANRDTAGEHDFMIGQDREGHWLAVETRGLGGGLFVTRDAALHYALSETGRRPGAVTLAPATILLAMTRRRVA